MKINLSAFTIDPNDSTTVILSCLSLPEMLFAIENPNEAIEQVRKQYSPTEAVSLRYREFIDFLPVPKGRGFFHCPTLTRG